jgi:hypothetical protein
MHAQRLLGRALACLTAAPLLGLAAAVPANAQVSGPVPAPKGTGNPDASLERVIGEVTVTNLPARQIALKMDSGGMVTVLLQDKTLYLRVPPGETNQTNAVKITPADIAVGDRVYARGRLAEDQKSIPALAIIVMTKADLTKRREREIEEWQKRGVAGSISALNAETKEISLSVRSPAGTRTVIIQPSQETMFHRYAPDSVQLGQAKPSAFDELKVGDALRILGDKNADGTRIKAEAIVSGSFRNIAGIVSGVDAAAGEIRITDLQSRRPLSVQVTAETIVRRMPPAKPAAPANRPQAGGGSPASGAQPSTGRTQGGAAPAATTTRPQAGGSGTASGGRGASGAGGLTDLQRMPVLSLRELKRDEAILVLCTVGAEPSRVTAIVVVAGIEPLLGPALQDQTQIGGAWNFFDISVP